jgi:hypothetical protein
LAVTCDKGSKTDVGAGVEEGAAAQAARASANPRSICRRSISGGL